MGLWAHRLSQRTKKEGVGLVKVFKQLFEKKRDKGVTCSAIVPAAGRSNRMGEDKVLLPIGDVPVLLRTLRTLEECSYITEIIVATREDLIVPVAQLCKEAALSKVRKVVLGGESRTASVLAGLHEASPDTELVVIHDAARPLVTREIIEETILKAAQCGAAAPAVPVKDTIKQAVHGVVTATPKRSELFAIQTPQVFAHDLILGALEKAVADGADLTDDCSAVERLGMSVCLTVGSYENIKLTTPTDLAVAAAILEGRGEL